MVTEYVSKAWKAYKRNSLSFIAAMLVVSIISIAFVGIAMVPIIGSMGAAALTGDYTTLLLSMVQSFAGSLILILIGTLITIALQAGVVKMTAEALKGKTKVGTMFSTAKQKGFTTIIAYVLALIVAALVFGVFVLIGVATGIAGAFVMMTVGILAMIIVMMAFIFLYQAIVIDNASATDALKMSYRFFKANWTGVVGLYLLYMVASIAISLIPILGTLLLLLIVAPVFLTALTAMYMDPKRRSRAKTRRPARRKK